MSSVRDAPAGLAAACEAAAPRRAPLVDVRDLSVTIPGRLGDTYAVRNVSFAVAPGERVAVLGESGCGKTVTAMTLLGLQPPHARVSGAVTFDGDAVDPSSQADIERVVRRRTAIVFQDSQSSLNPVTRVGTQLTETLTLRGESSREAHVEAARMLGHVGMPDPEARMRNFPHELSGGMRQRVMISMALLAKPALLIADEPTTALDATVQAQVVDLMRAVQAETAMALLLITHDLAMAAELCDRAIVMYAGYVVEDVPMQQLLRSPGHPYSQALLGAMPRLDTPRDVRLPSIEGELPSARDEVRACPFLPRCGYATEACRERVPVLRALAEDHVVRCVNAAMLSARASTATSAGAFPR